MEIEVKGKGVDVEESDQEAKDLVGCDASGAHAGDVGPDAVDGGDTWVGAGGGLGEGDIDVEEVEEEGELHGGC